MSTEGPGGNNVIGIRDVFEAIASLRGELSAGQQRLSNDISSLQTEQAYLKGKIDGSLGMIRWLGPVGIAALVLGVLVMFHVIPVG